MKRLLTITLAALLIAAVAAPALAWEFSMTGQWEYRLRYWARLGGTDLFGIADLQNARNAAATTVGFAGPNIYNRGAVGAFFGDTANSAPGMLITRGGFSRSESDAFQDDSRIEINPVIQVNPAIRVFGRYNIGGFRHKYWQAGPNTYTFQDATAPNPIRTVYYGLPGTPPFERYATFRTSENAYDTAALGSWELFRATMQLPWGVLSLGAKDFPFGVGALLGYNTRADAFLLVVPYGPFRFLLSVWLARGTNLTSWATVPDSAGKRTVFNSLAMTYDNGPLSFGGANIWVQYHFNASQLGWTGAANTTYIRDQNLMLYNIFMKYNNGRVFTNLEYNWFMLDQYNSIYQPTTGNTQNVHQEGYLWFSEAGAFAGPAKVSLLYAISSGPVLNNGYVDSSITNQGRQDKVYTALAINNQVIDGYQYLMFNTYAGGNNGGWQTGLNFTADEVGKMTDAYCFAGRVDYAVASNLNVYGTYMWAHRLERAGFYKGGILSTGAAASAAQRQAFVLNNFGAPSAEVDPVHGINPFVDDGFLGWETNLGFDWKLLENFTFGMKYAYWQPGEWFGQAYQAVGMQSGALSTTAFVKGRSPIMGLWASMVVNF